MDLAARAERRTQLGSGHTIEQMCREIDEAELAGIDHDHVVSEFSQEAAHSGGVGAGLEHDAQGSAPQKRRRRAWGLVVTRPSSVTSPASSGTQI